MSTPTSPVTSIKHLRDSADIFKSDDHPIVRELGKTIDRLVQSKIAKAAPSLPPTPPPSPAPSTTQPKKVIQKAPAPQPAPAPKDETPVLVKKPSARKLRLEQAAQNLAKYAQNDVGANQLLQSITIYTKLIQ